MERYHLENQIPILPSDSPEKDLTSELVRCQIQSEWLTHINILHQKLAVILDLPSMIKAYSLWLAEFAQHDLIGYNNPDPQRIHMYCSYRGPDRRQAIQLAQEMLEEGTEKNVTGNKSGDFYGHRWAIQWGDTCGLLVLLCKEKSFPKDTLQIIDESLVILAASLNRAMECEKLLTGTQRDRLTELPNRLVFEEQIPSYIAQAKRYGRPLTLLSLQLDQFKKVNDNMGRPAGDYILQQVATVLKKEARVSDFLVRIGGDKFLAVLPNTNTEQGSVLAERLNREVGKLDMLKKHSSALNDLTINIGLSPWSEDVNMQEWIDPQDNILYQTKVCAQTQ